MLCLTCQQSTNNPKFCSRSCAVKMNNILYPKRTRSCLCCICGKQVYAHKKYCVDCSPYTKGDITLEQAIYKKHHKSSAFALVRSRARAIAKYLNWSACAICGYNTHIEIAHIKPIASFALDTKLNIINHPTNLIPLCPNHHWEFDNGLIEVPQTGLEPV